MSPLKKVNSLLSLYISDLWRWSKHQFWSQIRSDEPSGDGHASQRCSASLGNTFLIFCASQAIAAERSLAEEAQAPVLLKNTCCPQIVSSFGLMGEFHTARLKRQFSCRVSFFSPSTFTPLFFCRFDGLDQNHKGSGTAPNFHWLLLYCSEWHHYLINRVVLFWGNLNALFAKHDKRWTDLPALILSFPVWQISGGSSFVDFIDLNDLIHYSLNQNDSSFCMSLVLRV